MVCGFFFVCVIWFWLCIYSCKLARHNHFIFENTLTICYHGQLVLITNEKRQYTSKRFFPCKMIISLGERSKHLLLVCFVVSLYTMRGQSLFPQKRASICFSTFVITRSCSVIQIPSPSTCLCSSQLTQNESRWLPGASCPHERYYIWHCLAFLWVVLHKKASFFGCTICWLVH